MQKIQKRDGRIVAFDPQKISTAIAKAFSATRENDGKVVSALTGKVLLELLKKHRGITHVEDVQDTIEHVLIANGYERVAKAFILYRKRHSEIREAKAFLGVSDELKLSVNAIRVLRKRYLKKDDSGRIVETPMQLFRRVAHSVAIADRRYQDYDYVKTEEEFYKVMAALEFLPNSPTLMNAGTPIGQLAACFVLPVPDSINGIFETLKDMALIHQSGGGTGFGFSSVRPRGDIVGSTKGIASGPVSFMKVYDSATEEIKQGGRRRGANMGILRIDHPDIIDFITSKQDLKTLHNFNISVAVTGAFMKAVEKNQNYDLINPHTGKVTGSLPAREVFDLIVTMAWRTGDPGMIFIDEINRKNPTPAVGPIEATNPCGEQPLLPNESCNLGSINLGKMALDGKINWARLKEVIHIGVHFLDNVVDVNKYPLQQIEQITKANRKIGLGVMGFADLLTKLNIPYNSKKTLGIARELMRFIDTESKKASMNLAKTRGSFPNFEKSIWKKKYPRMRNATTTTVAPTGTISIIAGCSSGIEPLFAVSYVRNVMEGAQLLEVNAAFEETAKKHGFYGRELMLKIARKGSIAGFPEIPLRVRQTFVTAFDIDPEWHIRVQAEFQKYTDSAVSKTINFPQNVSKETVEKAYKLAYKLKCKGITIYRYGSKKDQVLTISEEVRKIRPELQYVAAHEEYAGGCASGECPF
ncbi:vitamin B12-dependent ribonucleotide reductase [Candidatus Woesearchaeota archaeon]|nr:vitamin B12-dependent ribonucleotide reductase [Candidatus Woesearchaeota archaeon]